VDFLGVMETAMRADRQMGRWRRRFPVYLRTPVKPTGAVLGAPCKGTADYSRIAAGQPGQPLVEPRRVARGKAPAQPALAFRTEGHAGRQAQAVLGHQALGEGQRVVLPSTRKKAYMPPAGWPPARPAAPAARHQPVAAGLHAGTRPGTKSSAIARAARPPRCTKTGAQELLNSISLPAASRWPRRQHQPAQAPAGHQEALAEAVRHHQPVLGAAMSRNEGAAASPKYRRS
jgi:hypothetical protein